MTWTKGKLGTLCMVNVGSDFRIWIASALDSFVWPTLLLYMLCTFVLFFSKAFVTKTIQIKGLVQFRLDNPEHLHAFQIIKSGHT